MQDVSGSGLRIRLVASVTFPQGITLSAFADDSDPFDVPSIEIGSNAMGLNGDLVFWSAPKPIAVNLAVIPQSDDDRNLDTLFEANRVGRGKLSARDVVTMTAIYPNNAQKTLAQGKIMSGMPATGVASSGRLKTKTFGFVFEGLSRS